MIRYGWLMIVMAAPLQVLAAVSFSEIAWMGGVSSANHEWIELHNIGPEVDVTDWQVTDGMNLNISLSGSLPANSRVVLERTSDASAPGTAFLVYTGALVNTGATLKLLRRDGSIEDQVYGGSDWGLIGGDNVTKETAQYTTSGWVTALPSPGAAPDLTVQTVEQSVEAESDNSAGITKSKDSGKDSIYLELPDVTLKLDAKVSDRGYVNQLQTMSVAASGVGDTLINSLRYEWNFGDGTAESGREVSHIYRYPGTYVVTLYASYKRQFSTTRQEITVLPVSLSLTQNRQGDVQVNNDSPYELDLSGYELKGGRDFVFPARTIILANQTITIPKQELGEEGDLMMALYDGEGTMVSSLIPEKLQKPFVVAVDTTVEPDPLPRVSSITYSPPVAMAANEVESGSTKDKETAFDNEPLKEISESASKVPQLASVQSAASGTNQRLPYVLLVVTVLLAIFGIYLAPSRNSE